MIEKLLAVSCGIWLTILTYDGILLHEKLNSIEPEIINIELSVEDNNPEYNTKYYHVDSIELTDKEIACLERNIYFEAGIESYDGKLAVAQVTLNRLNTERWGNNLCNVVYAKAQFSWTLYSKNKQYTPTGKLWDESKQVARDVINGVRIKGLEKSLYYHADYINTPIWADNIRECKQIGKHIFYEG